MKKLIAGLLLLCMLTACGAEADVSTQEVANAYAGAFNAEATAVFGESKTEMSIAKKPESITVLLNSPAELKGMGIELFDEHAVITYQGMTQEINTDNLPEGTPFLLLEELFDELADPEEYSLSTKDGELSAQNDDFAAVLNPENFVLLNAEFTEYATKFTFSEFAFAIPE